MEEEKEINQIKQFSDGMYNRFMAVLEPHSELVKHEYDCLQSSFLRLNMNDRFRQKFEDISLSFEHWDMNSGGSIHWANILEKSEPFINLNLHSSVKTRYKYIIIHEFSHLIAWEYLAIKDHTLEFAIICYCLEVKFLQTNKNHLRAYDIHEDRAYDFLFIKPSTFDSVINGIKFTSLEELTDKASILATKIRLKQAPFTVAEWEKDALDTFDNKDK